jgi:alpha-1,2-mannosyltransferase
MALAGPGLRRVSGAGPSSRQRAWALPVAALVCALALAGYLTGVAVQHPGQMLSWYDLTVYKDAGLIVRSAPRRLYTWQLHPGIKFTYTPFFALVFAVCSLLPWAVLRWLMTVTSLAALAVTLWLTLGALGWRGRQRATLLAGVAAVSLWTEPVQRALHLGQVELLLMVLIVWDLCQPDRRWWKGAGVGIAAGIKLVPLIFIPYLVLAGKLRQAAAVTAAFLGTIVVGFAFLPHTSDKYWLTGYFIHPGNVGDVQSLLNQSLLGLVAREIASVRHATPIWFPLMVLVAAAGLVAAALLDRAGRTVAGWLTCALIGLLCSPISWDQHWIWVVPAIALFADAALRARGAARWAWWGLAVVVAGLLGAWGPLFLGEVYPLPGSLQSLSSNLFVEVGLGLLVVAIGAAWRVHRAGSSGQAAGQILDRSHDSHVIPT